jgi:hypothetical protein
MLEVDYIAIAKGGNFDPMHPTVRYRVNRLSLDSPKFVIQSGMKVVGAEFREISRKEISASGFDRRAEIAFFDLLGKSRSAKKKA